MDGSHWSVTLKKMIARSPVKNVRHRKTDHGDEGAQLVEPRILPVGGDDADRHCDEDADQVGKPDHPERLRQALDDEVRDRAARRPGAHPQARIRIADLHAEGLLDEVERLVDEELLHPFGVADVEGLPEPQRLANLLARLRRDGKRELAGGIIGREIEKGEEDEADRGQRRHREEQTADDVVDHRPR